MTKTTDSNPKYRPLADPPHFRSPSSFLSQRKDGPGGSSNSHNLHVSPLRFYRFSKRHKKHSDKPFHFPAFAANGLPTGMSTPIEDSLSPEQRRNELSARAQAFEREGMGDIGQEFVDDSRDVRQLMTRYVRKSPKIPGSEEYDKASFTPPAVMAGLLLLVWMTLVAVFAVIFSTIS